MSDVHGEFRQPIGTNEADIKMFCQTSRVQRLHW